MTEAALIRKYQPLVRAQAFAWSRPGVEADDLISEGNIGLVHAARKFDPTRGMAFSNYARKWVESYMRRHLTRFAHGVVARPTRDGAEERSKYLRDASFDEPLRRGKDAALDDITLHDLLPAPGPDPERAAIISEACEQLERAVNEMPAIEQGILRARLAGEVRDSIGARFGLSRERIRQREARMARRMSGDILSEAERRLLRELAVGPERVHWKRPFKALLKARFIEAVVGVVDMFKITKAGRAELARLGQVAA